MKYLTTIFALQVASRSGSKHAKHGRRHRRRIKTKKQYIPDVLAGKPWERRKVELDIPVKGKYMSDELIGQLEEINDRWEDRRDETEEDDARAEEATRACALR